jgi:hypothetical protein
MRELTDIERVKLANGLMAEIARAVEDMTSEAVKISLRRYEHWGELQYASVNAVEAMEEYHDSATASRLAEAFAELALAVGNCYTITPDFYAVSEFLWQLVNTAINTEEAR